MKRKFFFRSLLNLAFTLAAFDLSADLIYFTASISGPPANGVYAIDSTSNTIVSSTSINDPSLAQLALTPDGKFAYVIGTNNTLVYVVDNATNTVVKEITSMQFNYLSSMAVLKNSVNAVKEAV